MSIRLILHESYTHPTLISRILDGGYLPNACKAGELGKGAGRGVLADLSANMHKISLFYFPVSLIIVHLQT